MGQLQEEWVMHRFIKLTAEDCRKQEERRRRRIEAEIHPRLLDWQKKFTERLSKCPVCLNAPRMCCIFVEGDGYHYKFCCDFDYYHSPDGYTHDMGCGDWYNSLSRAGLSWNRMVDEAMTGNVCRPVRHKPFTQTQQRKRTCG